MFSRLSRSPIVAIAALLLVGLIGIVALDGRGGDTEASAAFIPHDGLVPDTAKNGYPIIQGSRAEQVYAADQAGRHIVSGGSFQRVELQDGSVLNQPYFAAWNIDTKQITCPNEFSFDDEVLAVEPGPTISTVYVGGRFTKVTGADGVQRTRNKIALIDLADCSVDRTFVSTGANGKVSEIVLVGDRVFLGGDFNAIGGQAVETLAELDAESGVVNPGFDFATSGELSSRIRGMGADPDGTRLIFGGRFGSMTGPGGSAVQPTGMIDISDPNAPRLTAHRSSGYVGVNDLQDVSISPDGTKIGLAYGTATVSDYAYLTPAVEAATTYTWVHYMRDSSFGIGVSNNAVYVSGHFCKVDSGPGATQTMTKRLDFGCTGDFFAGGAFRTQIAALSMTDGTPLTWNPGNDAGNGGRELTITTRGLLSGYDGNRTDGKRVGSLAFYDFGPGVEDTEPPETVQFSSPDAGESINNPALLAGSAEDNLGVATYQVAVQADDGRWVQADASLGGAKHVFTAAPKGDGSFELEVFMPAGDYTVEARAIDGAGLISDNWARRDFTQTGIEGIRPEATIETPGQPVPVETRVLVAGDATDNVEVDRIDIEVTNTAGEWIQDDRSLDDRRNTYPYAITDGGLGTPALGWEIDLGGLLPADTYTVTLTVTDASDNTRTVTDTFVTTTDPPLVGEAAITSLTGFSTAGGNYTMGYTFTVDEDTQLAAAGIFDANGNGTLDNPAAAEIGVWQRSNQQLLWQGSVDPDANVDADWFYTDLDEPIELRAGVEYVVGHRVFNGGEPRVNANGTADKVDGFTIRSYAYRSINGFAYPSSQGANQVGYGTPNIKLGEPVVVVPRVSIDTPVERQLNEDIITIAGTVRDNLEVASLSAKLTNAAGEHLQDDGSFDDDVNFLNLNITGINTEKADYSLEIGRLPLGDYRLTVSGTDLVANTTTKVRDFEVTNVGLVAEPAITAYTPGNTSTGAYTMGYTFTVDEDSQASAIGIFDTNGNGTLDNPADAEIGIWRRSDQQLLADGIVPPNTQSEDGWFYGDLDQTVALEAGEYYVVGYRQFSGGEAWAYNGTMDRVDGFTIRHYAYRSINGFAYPNSQGNNTIGYGVPNVRLGVEQQVKPVVSIGSPADRVYFADPVIISGTVTDNAEVTAASAQLTNSAGRYLQDDGSFATGANNLNLTVAGRNTTEVAWSQNLGQLPVGEYTLTVTGVDFVDNTTVSTFEFVVTDVIAEPMIVGYTNFASTTGNYTMGYTFTVDEDAFVHELGIFDTNANGSLDNPQDTPIGIWRRSNNQLLSETAVARNTDAEDGFFWAELDDALELEAGVEYVVGYRMWSGGEPWAYNGNATLADEHPGLNVLRYAYRSISGFAYPSTQGNLTLNNLQYGIPNMKIGVTPPVANQLPVIEPIANQNGTVDVAITPLQLNATDPEGGELDFDVDQLPAGLTMDDDGRITGTPTAAGATTSTVTVTDVAGGQAQATVAWTISADGGGPVDAPCVATTRGDDVVLTWDPIAGEDDKYQVRRNGGWLAVVDFDATLTFTDTNAPQGATYVIRSREGGVNTNVSCSDAGQGGGDDGDGDAGDGGGDVPTCAASFNDGQVTLSWDTLPDENDNYQIRVNGDWKANVRFDAGNTWTGDGGAADTFVVRSREGGVTTDLIC